MKKNLALLMVFFAGFFALQGCDEKKIDFDKLPSAAQAFITQYFPGEEVTYAERDKDDGQKDYKVRLSDGTEIEFDENGNWTSVDCAIPHCLTAYFRQRQRSVSLPSIPMPRPIRWKRNMEDMMSTSPPGRNLSSIPIGNLSGWPQTTD